MNKRFIAFLIIASVLITSLSSVPKVSAETRASDYFSNYTAVLTPGDSSGEMHLTYRVTAATTGIIRLGIVALFVYRTDGSIARVVTGNTSNGLIKTSGTIAVGTYIFTMDPGVAYYCNIRFVAENASGSDSRPYTTNTAVAPL